MECNLKAKEKVIYRVRLGVTYRYIAVAEIVRSPCGARDGLLSQLSWFHQKVDTRKCIYSFSHMKPGSEPVWPSGKALGW